MSPRLTTLAAALILPAVFAGSAHAADKIKVGFVSTLSGPGAGLGVDIRDGFNLAVKQLNGLVWGLAAVVAAVAGLLLAPITFVHANMGLIGLKAFPAAVVGGFTSLPGAIVGGIIIGVVESLSGFYLPEGFKDIAAYVVVLLMLMIKPNGLFGERLRKKV